MSKTTVDFDTKSIPVAAYNGKIVAGNNVANGKTQKQIIRSYMKQKKKECKKALESYERALNWHICPSDAYLYTSQLPKYLLSVHHKYHDRKRLLAICKQFKVKLEDVFNEGEVIQYEESTFRCIVCDSPLDYNKNICTCGRRYIIGDINDTGLINTDMIPLHYDNYKSYQLLDRYWDGLTDEQSLSKLENAIPKGQWAEINSLINTITNPQMLKEKADKSYCAYYSNDNLRIIHLISDYTITQRAFGRVGSIRFNNTILDLLDKGRLNAIVDLISFKLDAIEYCQKYIDKYIVNPPRFNGDWTHDKELIHDMCKDLIDFMNNPCSTYGTDKRFLNNTLYIENISEILQMFADNIDYNQVKDISTYND